MKISKPIWSILKWVFLMFFLVMALFPLVWLFLNSFRTNLELQTVSFAWPSEWQWVNYKNALEVGNLPQLFFNSVLVTVLSLVVNIVVSALAGFVLSREQFIGREALYLALTAGVLIPIISFMAPYFTTVSRLGLYNTKTALMLVYAAVNIPVSIFLITAFMRTIPREMEEAAIIDGCNFFGRFTKIIFPLSRSGLVTAGTFCVIYAWNEFVMAMLLTSSTETRTIQLGIRFFTSQFITDYTSMFAAIIISMIPTIVAYMFLHDKIISGLAAGGVKG